jgi:hypothetical protein
MVNATDRDILPASHILLNQYRKQSGNYPTREHCPEIGEATNQRYPPEQCSVTLI